MNIHTISPRHTPNKADLIAIINKPGCLALDIDVHAPDDGVREDASSKRCPVNPRLTDGETTHAEHPIHPVSTATANIILRRVIIVKTLAGREELGVWQLPQCFHG